VDLADVEDEFVDSVSELGRQAEEGRELLVAFPSVGGQRSEQVKGFNGEGGKGTQTYSSNSGESSLGKDRCNMIRILRWRSLFSCIFRSDIC
jgi:hypothetical protein